MTKPRTCGRFNLADTIVSLLCAAMAIPATGQTFKTIVSFDGTDGAEPNIVLAQGRDGNFYGMTGADGAHNAGTVFRVTGTGGALKTLYNFCSQPGCTDGANTPLNIGGGLLLATDGNFYGTTPLGGTHTNCNQGNQSCGTVFRITPGGAFNKLHDFSGADGSFPNGLVQGTDGNFYGTAQEGGANNAGTVFKFNRSDNSVTTLYNFCSQPSCTDGGSPDGALVQATDGNFYGTTFGGGNGGGTVFKITPTGKLTTLAAEGGFPAGTLVQGSDGNFYGTAARASTAFKMTPSGKLTTLGAVGAFPYAGLVQATDKNLYGTAYMGGLSGDGTVFEITTTNTVTTPYTFCSQTNCTDGAFPLAGLIQGTDGNLYGVTISGGDCATAPNCYGSVFSLGVGLGPFVEALTYSGKVGDIIEFLGQDFTSSTTVSFNGTSATPIMESGTFLTVAVPGGATTGLVTITTSIGSLKSNKRFRVTPQIKSFAPKSGAVGTSVTITGVSLTQTSLVTFGGVKASTVTVNSDTQVTAAVPTGAKTGKIAVTTPGGSAGSATFTVTP